MCFVVLLFMCVYVLVSVSVSDSYAYILCAHMHVYMCLSMSMKMFCHRVLLCIYVYLDLFPDLFLSSKRLRVCFGKTPTCSKHVCVLPAHTVNVHKGVFNVPHHTTPHHTQTLHTLHTTPPQPILTPTPAWCFQVKRMIGGIRNVLFSTYSQTPMGKIDDEA